jgi:hypothetical protein
MASEATGKVRVDKLSLAAYLKMKGLKLDSVKRPVSGSAQFYFIFHDPDGQFETLEVEFFNSESRKFDDEVRALKDMIRTK